MVVEPRRLECARYPWWLNEQRLMGDMFGVGEGSLDRSTTVRVWAVIGSRHTYHFALYFSPMLLLF